MEQLANRTLPGKGPKNTIEVSTNHVTNTSNTSNTHRTNKYYNKFVSLREKYIGKTMLLQAQCFYL